MTQPADIGRKSSPWRSISEHLQRLGDPGQLPSSTRPIENETDSPRRHGEHGEETISRAKRMIPLFSVNSVSPW